MRNKYIIMILIILSSYLSSGCTRVCTREFLINKESKEVMTEDWQFDVNFFAYRMMIGENPNNNDFLFRLNPINNKGKKTNNVYDIRVDTIYFTSIPPAFEKALATNVNRWLSYQSLKYLEKYIYRSEDQYREYGIDIPNDIDTLVLDFNAILRKGKLAAGHIYVDNYYMDSVIADTNYPEIRKHVQLKLVRHESCSKYPFFVRYFN